VLKLKRLIASPPPVFYAEALQNVLALELLRMNLKTAVDLRAA
jgi:hypothetical protein